MKRVYGFVPFVRALYRKHLLELAYRRMYGCNCLFKAFGYLRVLLLYAFQRIVFAVPHAALMVLALFKDCCFSDGELKLIFIRPIRVPWLHLQARRCESPLSLSPLSASAGMDAAIRSFL